MTHATATPTTERPAAPSGSRWRFDYAYAVLSVVFLVAVLVQIYLAGYGAYAPHHGPHVVHHAFSAHEDLGNYLGIASVVLFVIALVARTSRKIVIYAFCLALLTEPVQHALATFGKDHRWLGGLHAVVGITILILAVIVAVAGYHRRLNGSER